jgi:Uma2 family endonuclease
MRQVSLERIMSTLAPTGKPAVHYPDSDGQPMADNTIQYRWIAILKWNAEALYRHDPNVFVAGDHLIYPVEGDPTIRQAPDVYVSFGPRKGDRGSYKVFEEGGVFPQVIFEVWSPNNRYDQMRKKFDFYEKYGAEEYYIVYPEFPAHLEGWIRKDGKLVAVKDMNGHVSPRLGFRFHLLEGELTVFDRAGQVLRDPVEIIEELEKLGRDHARLAAKLRELGGDPDKL